MSNPRQIKQYLQVAGVFVGVVIFFAVIIYVSLIEKEQYLAQLQDQYKDCEYIGSRYDDGRKVYRYDCNGTVEEILYQL